MSRIFTALSLVVASLAFAVAGASAAAGPITGVDVVHGGMYSSAGWNDIAADYINMGDWAGKDATFGGTFHDVFESEGSNWDGNTAWLLESVWDGHATPMANLTLNASAAAIANGSYDNDIRKWMQRVKAWVDQGGNRSLFIAPLQEHNGTWAPYGCDPVNFRAAYARFRSIGLSEGLDETKVRWVWAPNGWTSTTGACAGTSLIDYYPGAGIVDVIGFSAYRWTTEDVYASVGGTAAELRTFAPEKPYVALQTAAGPSATRDQWIRELFQWAADDPNMIGLVWFNIVKEKDWRVWAAPSGPGLSSGFRDAMSYSTTHYQWPLTDWFQPGDLPFSVDLGPLSDRISGSNRYATSVAVSEATFPSGVPVAYVATGLSFPDALAAAAAGGAQGGPVLLVDGQSVSPATKDELQRLNPSRIVVVGGQNAVSDCVVSTLQQIAPTERIGGTNRFATASMIGIKRSVS